VRRIDLITHVAAPPALVFDASLRVDVHTASMARSGEHAIDGVTSGLLRLGDSVTWQARHLGRRWRMTVEITALARPTYFVDEQVAGPFAVWRHEHRFTKQPGGATAMRDLIDFAAPYGYLGRIAEAAVLERYLNRLIATRNRHLAAICAQSSPQ
jgi:ligand-binding SRPBCC domain-containing protein